MRTLVFTALVFLCGVSVGLAIDQSAKASAESRSAARPDRRAICLDHLTPQQNNGYTFYALPGNCRVVAQLPESLLSDADLDTLDAMSSEAAGISATTDVANGVDIKLDALVVETAGEFRKNRASLCSRHPDLLVFDLNIANDLLPPQPCANRQR